MQDRLRYLFRKFLDNNCTKEEFDEVFYLIRKSESDPALKVLLEKELDAENIFAFADSNTGLLKSINEKAGYPADEENTSLKPTPVKRRLIWSIAASVVIAAGALLWFYSTGGSLHEEQSRYTVHAILKKETKRSEYKYLLLPDSTQVWLNAASTLEFPETFDSKKREVMLKGEAYFDVKHADKIPFIIYTGNVSTEVMGTAFNIKAYPDMEKITVAVKRGRVKVKYDGRQMALLSIGQQISIEKKDHQAKEKKLKAEETAAWQLGKLIYDDYSMGDVIRDLERIYNVNIHVEKDLVSGMRISTSFEKTQGLEKALEILCRLADAKLEKEDRNFYIK